MSLRHYIESLGKQPVLSAVLYFIFFFVSIQPAIHPSMQACHISGFLFIIN
jgi:hypothetical protein